MNKTKIVMILSLCCLLCGCNQTPNATVSNQQEKSKAATATVSNQQQNSNTTPAIVSNQNVKVEKADQYSLEKSFKSGVIVKKDTGNSENNSEIYNIKRLDEFVKSFKQGKEDEITIVEYYSADNKWVINKFKKLKLSNKVITLTEYDTASDKNVFKSSGDEKFDNIEEKQVQGITTYSISNINAINSGINLISFDKNQVKN